MTLQARFDKEFCSDGIICFFVCAVISMPAFIQPFHLTPYVCYAQSMVKSLHIDSACVTVGTELSSFSVMLIYTMRFCM